MPILLFAQLDCDIKNWDKDQKEFQERSLYYYNKFDLGDTVTILLEVDTTYEDEASGKIISILTLSNNPKYNWNYNPHNDVKLKGILIDKKIIRNNTSVTFSLKLFQILNERNVNGFWGQLGDTTKTEIMYQKLE
jgi:hypothetical protein